MTLFEQKRERILELKASLNAETGQPYTYKEIAKELGMKSGPAVHYYVSELECRCPGCLRKLKNHTTNQTKA